jgi:CHAT domain-containing protein
MLIRPLPLASRGALTVTPVLSMLAMGMLAMGMLALASCAKPPADAMVSGANSGPALDLGKNTANETCSLQQGGTNSDIFCGSYLEPAGQVETPTGASDPVAFLSGGPWRTSFESRFTCSSPVPTTVFGSPGATLACTRRQGGWQQSVLAVAIGGKLYVADGVKPIGTLLPTAIGVMAGTVPANPAKAVDTSGLETQRQAVQALNIQGAGAIAEVQRQMERGSLENRRGNYAAAESAYRAAISIQERIVGPNNPALAIPLAREGLQISNQGRYGEAEKVFARAAQLAAQPSQIDPLVKPTVANMQALDLLNRNKPTQALPLLDQAEQGFLAEVPPDAMRPRELTNRSVHNGVERLAQEAQDLAVMSNPTANEALNGVIETRRYKAIALGELGRNAEADAELQQAASLYTGRDPRLTARFYRTVGMVGGTDATDTSDLRRAVDSFARGQPNTIPMAQTQLLHAARLAAGGDYSDALAECRSAATILGALKGGVEAELLIPCFDALNTRVDKDGQPVLAEMFALSQLAQGSITSRQIALATARLAESARDPKVADAITAYDTASDRLETLYRRRLELGTEKANAAQAKDLDDQIQKALATQREAGEARQAAAPGFAALVQESVSAADVQALLQPNEALATMVMGPNEGWTLLIRKDSISAGRIEGGASKIDPLVKRFRAGMELGRDNRPPAFDTAAALGLYQASLGPVQAAISGVTTLTVAPAGSLLAVPFAALLTGPASADNLGKAPFLIQTTAISHVPSAASFVNLRKGAKTVQAANPWFGMGDFKPPTLKQAVATFPVDTCGESARELASLPPLPGAQRELEVARQLEGAPVSDQLLGANFTAQNVEKAPLKDFRILHFATHAILPGELRCQAEPAVLTSTPPNAPTAAGAMLTASMIQQLNLDAELVILAACNTGGENGGGAGESLSGLARAFFFAGARSLLVTHWDANDATTTYLTALFLAALRADPEAGPAMALATSQRRMLAEAVGDRSPQAHPYYWAVEALIGGRGGSAPAAHVASSAGRGAGG